MEGDERMAPESPSRIETGQRLDRASLPQLSVQEPDSHDGYPTNVGKRQKLHASPSAAPEPVVGDTSDLRDPQRQHDDDDGCVRERSESLEEPNMPPSINVDMIPVSAIGEQPTAAFNGVRVPTSSATHSQGSQKSSGSHQRDGCQNESTISGSSLAMAQDSLRMPMSTALSATSHVTRIAANNDESANRVVLNSTHATGWPPPLPPPPAQRQPPSGATASALTSTQIPADARLNPQLLMLLLQNQNRSSTAVTTSHGAGPGWLAAANNNASLAPPFASSPSRPFASSAVGAATAGPTHWNGPSQGPTSVSSSFGGNNYNTWHPSMQQQSNQAPHFNPQAQQASLLPPNVNGGFASSGLAATAATGASASVHGNALLTQILGNNSNSTSVPSNLLHGMLSPEQQLAVWNLRSQRGPPFASMTPSAQFPDIHLSTSSTLSANAAGVLGPITSSTDQAASGAAVAPAMVPAIGHNSNTAPMSAPTDEHQLSRYQFLLRQQLEYFVSQKDDAEYSVQGRRKQARLGQVGIRCMHCVHLPHRLRGRGAGYYPAKLSGVYQAAQNMATNHLIQFCSCIPSDIRDTLRSLRGSRADSSVGGGKQYWADACVAIGLVEDEEGEGLRFRRSNSNHASIPLT